MKQITPQEAIAMALTLARRRSYGVIGPHSQAVDLVLRALDQAGWEIVEKKQSEREVA